MRPDILYPYFKSVTSLKGVGPALATTLHRIMATHLPSLPRVRDLLFYAPIDVTDRSFSPPLHSAPPDTVCTFEVTVDNHIPPGTRMRHASKKPYRVQCSNDTGDMMIVFFHVKGDWVEKALPVGQKRIISGKTEHFDFRLQMTHPDIIVPVSERDQVIGFEPVYPLTQGLTNKKLRGLVAHALEEAAELPEWYDEIPAYIKEHLSFNAALHAIHHPTMAEDIEPEAPARIRLAFDELVAEQLVLHEARDKLAQQDGMVLPPTSDLWERLTNQLPFTLTDSQLAVLDNIAAGLISTKRYIRLLQGDVGSGKTIIALFAMLRAVENGHQAALMVPTEIVAQQHYYKLRELCDVLGVHVAYLTGSIKGAARKEVLGDIESGHAQIIIGTHALFQEKVTFQSLALVVIDEQHRFGVEQRMALVNKGDQPHILHMTATPIPRSLMMTYYGDMEPLYLREKPLGRLPITTRVVPLSRADELLERIQAALDADEKIYWICPQIELATQTDLIDQDIAAVEFRYTEFKTRFGANKVALIHGRIPQAERDATMRKFARGDIKMVVATTVIEVGVDVPDATIMIIESAERFGLSQLHQLRGRVGRGEKQSYCILLYKDTADETARARLTTLREHDDGFAIADMDLELRGGGELMGTRQSGGKSYHFVKPGLMAMLPEAHKVAKEMSGKKEAEILKELFI